MADLHQASARSAVRRLAEATSYSGKLKCTFDASIPLNLSDPSQPFLMTCATPLNGFVVVDYISSLIGYAALVLLVVGVMYLLFIWAREKLQRKDQAAAPTVHADGTNELPA